jgi:thiamine biosynthesis lipoprotein
LIFGLGCRPGLELDQYEFDGRAMGTSFSVKVVSAELSEAEVAGVEREIEGELEAVNGKMSTYLDSSELSRLNKSSGAEPVEVSPELLGVLVAARQIGVATRGAFDITVGPIVNAWGFGPAGRPEKRPTEKELERLAGLTGWDEVSIEEASSSVRKSSAGVRLDLSGIAKGFGVDQVSEALSERGYGDHMVEVGGEVRLSGRNRARGPWRIAIERPVVGERAIHRVLPLSDLALATSGDYRNFYEENGIRYSHIIDPRTRRPIQHRLASVSVVDESCARADGYATALLVLGENEAYDVASAGNVAALFLIREADGTFTEKATPRFAALFGNAGDTE